MDKSPFTPSLLLKSPLALAAGVLSLTTLLLALNSAILFRSNRSLLAKSQELQKTLETIEEKNRNVLEKIDADRQSAEASLAQLKRENEAFQVQIKTIQEEMSMANEEKTYLEDVLIHKTREIERLKGAPAAATSSAATMTTSTTGTTSELAAKIKEKDAQIQKLAEQNKILANKLDELYRLTNQKISEINVAKIALEETISQARKSIETALNAVDLGSISVNPGSSGAQQTAATAPVRNAPKKEGKVLAVNQDHGFVVVDIGKVDGLRSDTTLALSKNGKEVATLAVLEVRDVMSACNIKSLIQGQKIEINDLVLIRK
ncbi:MAG TPA: hypothetical protein VD883_00455 [Candidatus Omnitrophota bacterium]|nr:hypothetical protein [Candidatus Omnitrophota bacterium]